MLIWAGEWARPISRSFQVSAAQSFPNLGDVEVMFRALSDGDRRWVPREALITAAACRWGWARGRTEEYLAEAAGRACWILEESEGALRGHICFTYAVDDAACAWGILEAFRGQ